MRIEDILAKVPAYDTFLTVDEMDASTLQLAKDYPDVVTVTEVGRSRWNHPIYCLKIGSGSQNALMYGTPHPNEPIGAMMLEFFSRELAENEELRRELDYTFYIIKSSDPDGTSLNEGWFKGPFTISHYQRNFFRPAFAQQVEWSFPIDYKTLHFHAPIPETKVLMELIDQKKPTFIYSLHNAGFGGCYWYLTDGDEALYKALYRQPALEKVPLHLGEPEAPYCEEFYPGMYRMLGVTAQYDYLEKFVPDKDPATMITSGTSSDEYANREGKLISRALVNEMPYFYDQRIDDTTPSDMIRREAVLINCDQTEAFFAALTPLYERVKPLIHTWNPFFISVEDRMAGSSAGNMDAKRQWAMAPEFEEKATVAQKFENLYGQGFYRNLSVCLLWRACTYELEHGTDMSDAARAELEAIKADAGKLMEENLRYLEENLHYQAIPIQKLVRIQLASGLLYAKYVHDKN